MKLKTFKKIYALLAITACLLTPSCTPKNEINGVKYDYVEKLYGGVYQVKLNGKFGRVSDSGEILVDIKYDYVGDFNSGIAIVKLNGKFGCIDIYGNETWDYWNNCVPKKVKL